MEMLPVTGKSPSRLGVIVLVLACLELAALAGCGATQFEPKNRHLLGALQTAVTSKNQEWLAAVAEQAREQHENHSLSDAEFKAVSAVIESATAGDWKTAEIRVFALSEGQKPTAADVERVRERKTAAK
jgi:hypothetical protein